MTMAGRSEQCLKPFTEIAQDWREAHGYGTPDNKKDAQVSPDEKDSTIDQRAEVRLWAGFQKRRKMFLGVSVALALYSWGNVEIEKLAFFGASFTIQNEWTFKSLILTMWLLLGWRYWTYEKEVRAEEFQGGFYNIRREKLRGVLKPHLKGLLEEKVPPEYREVIDKQIEKGEFWLLRSTSWGKIKVTFKQGEEVEEEPDQCRPNEFILEIKRCRELIAHGKSWWDMAIMYRQVSDCIGPYLVALFAFIGLTIALFSPQ